MPEQLLEEIQIFSQITFYEIKGRGIVERLVLLEPQVGRRANGVMELPPDYVANPVRRTVRFSVHFATWRE